MDKRKVVFAIIIGLCILAIGLSIYKKNQNPIFEMYVSVDPCIGYYDSPDCYDESWCATLERLDNQQYQLKITQGDMYRTSLYEKYKYGLYFRTVERTDVRVLSKEEYKKFEDGFDYIQKNYCSKLEDKMYDGFYEGTEWFIYIKGKHYSSASLKKGDIREDYHDLMQDERVSRDFCELINSYMSDPPLKEPPNWD